MWCLYILILDPEEQSSWDVPLVLQHLDNHLNNSPPAEAARVSSIMYGYIGEVAALNQMLSALRLHRPRFSSLRHEDIMDEDRPIWRFLKENPNEDDIFKRETEWADLILPLTKFQMPMGVRDTAWLSKAELCRTQLGSVWVKVREALTGSYKRHKPIAVDIEQYRSMLSYHETPEQKARWAEEKQRIQSKVPTITAVIGSSLSISDRSQKPVAADAVPRIVSQGTGTNESLDGKTGAIQTSTPLFTASPSH